MREDAPINVKGWQPENYARDYFGPVTLTKALALSLNTVAVRLGLEVGPKAIVRVAHRLGIASDLSANPSIALGTSEVTPLEIATAYVPFANGGIGVQPQIIAKVKTASGKLLYQRKGASNGRVIDPNYVAMMNTMMQETLLTGTARKASVPGWQAAGKTGTSQDWRDAWFIGYTSHLVAGVWLGNDDNSPTKKASGGNLPVEIWSRFMRAAHQGVPPQPLPGGIWRDYSPVACRWRKTMAGPRCLETCRRGSTKRRKRPRLRSMAAPPAARPCLRRTFLTPGFSDKGAAPNPGSKTFSIRCSAVNISPGVVHREFDRATDNEYITEEDAFEWDDDKAAAIGARMVSLSTRRSRLSAIPSEWSGSMTAIVWRETHHCSGCAKAWILHVTYTERGEQIRLSRPGGRKNMSKTTTTAKIRSDGTVVEVLADGTERPFPDTSMRPMTEAEIEAAAGCRSRCAAHDGRRAAERKTSAAHKNVAPRARADAGGICRALSHPARHPSGLGARPHRAGSTGSRLS